MNKRKVLIIAFLAIIIIGISIYAFASKNLLQYTEDGKLIVFAGQGIPEVVEDGTPMVLAIPNESATMSPDEIQKKEKEEFAKSHSDLQNIVVEDYEYEDEHDEPYFMDVLYKYYGEEKINNLYSKIDEELNGNYNNEAKLLTPSQRKCCEMAIEIANSNEATNEEKEIMKEALKGVVSQIADEDIVEIINNL